jgi:hypothetical protein
MENSETPTSVRPPRRRRPNSYQADTGGHEAGAFQKIAERAHGARAIRSDRGEKDSIDLILLQKVGNLASTLLVLIG